MSGGLWSRCWWATWLSGFFGITGLLHIARPLAPFSIVLGGVHVPMAVSVSVGVACLLISAGLLWLEVRRAHARTSSKAQ